MWLHDVHIPEYTEGTWTNHAPRRKRKLLLHRAEIDKLIGKTKEGGLTLVPLVAVLQGRQGQGRDRAGPRQEGLRQAARPRRAGLPPRDPEGLRPVREGPPVMGGAGYERSGDEDGPRDPRRPARAAAGPGRRPGPGPGRRRQPGRLEDPRRASWPARSRTTSPSPPAGTSPASSRGRSAFADFAAGDEVFGYVRRDDVQSGRRADPCRRRRRCAGPQAGRAGFAEAGALPLAGLTAYQALSRRASVTPGDRVLVHAAAGGVGYLAVQIAVALGAHVIGTAGQHNHDFLATLGAAELIDYAAGPTRARWASGRRRPRPGRRRHPGRRPGQVRDGGRQRLRSWTPAVLALGGRYVFVRPDAPTWRSWAGMADAGELRVRSRRCSRWSTPPRPSVSTPAATPAARSSSPPLSVSTAATRGE